MRGYFLSDDCDYNLVLWWALITFTMSVHAQATRWFINVWVKVSDPNTWYLKPNNVLSTEQHVCCRHLSLLSVLLEPCVLWRPSSGAVRASKQVRRLRRWYNECFPGPPAIVCQGKVILKRVQRLWNMFDNFNRIRQIRCFGYFTRF